VQEKMGLPGNPYDVVHTMTHKDLFRKFMQREGFLTPHNVKVSSIEEAISVFENTKQKLMLKPTDSAGSKGVFAIESVNDIEMYWNKTISVSPSRTALLEDHIDSVGLQQDGDIFVIDGKIAFWGMCDQYKRKEEPFVPAALVYPSTQDPCLQETAKETVQGLLTKIGFKQGPCNVEYLVDKQGQVWVIEIGPRNGGNLIPFLIENSTGINITELTVMQAVGDMPKIKQPQNLCNTMTIVHRKDGKTTDLELITDKNPLKPW
jgi:biotin carboxylase